MLIFSTFVVFKFGTADFYTYWFLATLTLASIAAFVALLMPQATTQLFPSNLLCWQTYLVAATLSLGYFGFALDNASLRSATGDEISQAQHALGEPYYHFDTKNIVMAAALHHQPPLHYVASAASLRLLGRNELGARVPSIVFASLAVFAMFISLRSLGVSFTTTLLSTVTFATCSAFAIQTLEGRPYTAAIFASILFIHHTLYFFLSHRLRLATFLGLASSGILFVLSLGMQPTFMIAAILVASPLFANFNWRRVLLFFGSMSAVIITTSPILKLIASRAVLFTPSHSLDVFQKRFLDLPSNIHGDVVQFFEHGPFDTRTSQVLYTALLALTLVLASSRLRANAESKLSIDRSPLLPWTILGLFVSGALFFLATTFVFEIFVEYKFQQRHGILTFVVVYFLIAISIETILRHSRTFQRRSIRLLCPLVAIGIFLATHSRQILHFPDEIQRKYGSWDSREIFWYLKSIPGDEPEGWSATGYGLDILDARYVDFSGFFGKSFYGEHDFPKSIFINQSPRPHLPVWAYLLGDIRAGRTPSEMIFHSMFPYPGRESLSIAKVPWTPEDRVEVIARPVVVITRVKVGGSLLEAAIRFFDKIYTHYGKGPEVSLVNETRFRLYLEKKDCKSAMAAFSQIDPINQKRIREQEKAVFDLCPG